MKEEYESLDMDVIEFDTEDVITTSCTLFTHCENETDVGPLSSFVIRRSVGGPFQAAGRDPNSFKVSPL